MMRQTILLFIAIVTTTRTKQTFLSMMTMMIMKIMIFWGANFKDSYDKACQTGSF